MALFTWRVASGLPTWAVEQSKVAVQAANRSERVPVFGQGGECIVHRGAILLVSLGHVRRFQSLHRLHREVAPDLHEVLANLFADSPRNGASSDTAVGWTYFESSLQFAAYAFLSPTSLAASATCL